MSVAEREAKVERVEAALDQGWTPEVVPAAWGRRPYQSPYYRAWNRARMRRVRADKREALANRKAVEALRLERAQAIAELVKPPEDYDPERHGRWTISVRRVRRERVDWRVPCWYEVVLEPY